MKPTLPFVAEPIHELKNRYQESLTTTFDSDTIRRDPNAPRPGQSRPHVFDFESGLRLLISSERLATDDVNLVIHVSASLQDDTEHKLVYRLKKTVKKKNLAVAMREFRLAGEESFRELSGETRPMRFVGFSEGEFIPHWVIE